MLLNARDWHSKCVPSPSRLGAFGFAVGRNMHVTIAICTRNRADSLHRTLQSITLLKIPRQISWELIVVDNGSTDRTPGVIAHFVDRLPMRHLFEPTRGASMHATP